MAVKTVKLAPADERFKREFPKIWEYRYGDRKELSHWSKHELPLIQLIGKLDTDHWTKLKRRHQTFYTSMDPRSKLNQTSVNDLPKPHGGIQQHYYDQSRNRAEHLLQEGRTMYSLPDVHFTGNRNKTARRQPSIYNQHAKNGFKFWMEGDPNVNKISFCSKYTFGSKYTIHGLGNAPRN
ncbi:uncharacterized protein LOC116297049 isoform X1 [Actinia tenebrosa]|uniref:Uncharacterized protein LOC116297049 isoform X1 n=1 Tax=Actinia tenebrosa TaxID=6105 RepID=A0A6P8I0I1_ACTTE|nr:uncharacterized protein LOC116297049 isoform X1 [Actinia tenebrosa]